MTNGIRLNNSLNHPVQQNHHKTKESVLKWLKRGNKRRIIMKEEVFYPNKLTKEEVATLSGWKLKAATLHFGRGRSDCVTIGYGYEYRPEKYSDIRPDWECSDKKQIIVVADSDGGYDKPISLRGEIDWDSDEDLLSECGIDITQALRDHVETNIDEWFSEV